MSSGPDYGHAHRKRREQWKPDVEAGTVTCWRCHNLIEPGTPWDLGHDDADPSVTIGPEHARCNRATLTHAKSAGILTRRDW